MATAFGDADISRLAGFAVAGGLNYLFNRSSATTSGLTGIDATPPREDERALGAHRRETLGDMQGLGQ